MRLLFTSTFLVGIVMPLSVAYAQTAPEEQQTSNPAVSQQSSLFSANTVPTLRGARQQEPSVISANDPTAGRVPYPVRPAEAMQSPVAPLQGAGRRQSRDNAFEPIGIRSGSFLLYPSLSLFVDATDNVDNESTGQNGSTARAELEVRAESQWQRHALSVGAKGVFSSYQVPDRKPETELSLDADLRFDLAEQSQVRLRGSFDRRKEDANNPDLTASGGAASVETGYGLAATYDHGVGALKLQLRGAFDRDVFDSDGSRDQSTYTLGGRVGYEITDQVLPFVDVEVARKRYDVSNGSLDGEMQRGSFGVAVTDRDKLSGEISFGGISWAADDTSIERDTIFFADASVNWSPNALWTLRGGLETSLSSSSTGANTVATRTVSFAADFAARRDLGLSLDTSLAHEDYRGLERKDWVFDATFGAEYAFNRSVQLIVRVGHEWRDSNDNSADFTANKIEVGVRIRK